MNFFKISIYYLNMVKKGKIIIAAANTITAIAPTLFFSFQIEKENLNV
ncbi:hypothetical protein [Bacillus massilinigeriensis]|nr:hypothetical protein [Bacillus massilionigeriensis]